MKPRTWRILMGAADSVFVAAGCMDVSTFATWWIDGTAGQVTWVVGSLLLTAIPAWRGWAPFTKAYKLTLGEAAKTLGPPVRDVDSAESVQEPTP